MKFEPFDPLDKEMRIQQLARELVIAGKSNREAFIDAQWMVNESERRLQIVASGETPETEPYDPKDDEEGDDLDDEDEEGDDDE